MTAPNPLQAEVDRLRAEVQSYIDAQPSPPPGVRCSSCGQVNERGIGWDGERTDLGAPDREVER